MSTLLFGATITPINKTCPFINKQVNIVINKGQCFWLEGQSGAGKTTLIRHLAGLAKIPGATVETQWAEGIDTKQGVGVLFQQGVLLDTLSVNENLALSCKVAGMPYDSAHINACLASVKLRPEDGHKMPGQLSGGMLRRAALAQILSQKKQLIILDEPFVGLDESTAQEIVETLIELRDAGQAFLLISHDAAYAKQLATEGFSTKLVAQKRSPQRYTTKRLRWRFPIRLSQRLVDYLGISLPLIVCAFIATGLAISTLFCQLLTSVDLTQIVSAFTKATNLSWTQHLMLHVVKAEAKTINTQYMPIIHAKLYALVLGKTFLTQLGPMLTALLLVGRIGGSYTGEIAMMQATQQNALLRTLGLSPRRWTLLPTAIAAFIAAPLLTVAGSAVALLMAGLVSVHGVHVIYPSMAAYWNAIEPHIFPKLAFWHLPLVISSYRSLGFMLIILAVSEICGRCKAQLQPRDVPKTITWSIVIASLLILIADWGFTAITEM